MSASNINPGDQNVKKKLFGIIHFDLQGGIAIFGGDRRQVGT
jgi:hypothetical protein